MKVSIVIPTLNAGALFQEVLEAVRAQEFPDKVELVIVDSESEDGTWELSQRYADLCFQIPRIEFNHGQTRNLAIERSSGELIALLVQDASPLDKNWLKNLVRNFENSKVAGVFSRQIARDNCNPLLRLRLEGWGAGKQEKRVQEWRDFQGLKPEQIIELFSFDNVSSMVRREVWEEVHFPARRFAEDILWAKEVMNRGYKIVYEPESVVAHSHNKSLWYEFKRVYLDHSNWWQVGGFRVFNRPIEVLGASLRGAVETIRILFSKDLSFWSWLRWSFYALFFIFSQNLAQYMGGWAERWREKYPWYDKIDKKLSRGV